LNHLQAGRFHGYFSSWPQPREIYKKATAFNPPAVWFPRKLCYSASGMAEITDPRFGPFQGQLLVGEFGNATVMRVALEKVGGEWQGAVWPFAKGFVSGPNRLVMGPDGGMYVGCLKRAWGSAAPGEFSLERIRFTGKTPFEVREVRAHPDGFELRFTQPVDRTLGADAGCYDVAQFTYKYHEVYGSPEIDHAGKENSSTPITVASVQVSSDGLTVKLGLTGWRAGYVTAVRSSVKSTDGRSLWHDTFYYTLNQIPAVTRAARP
jgi:hypothetical protein